MSKTIDIHFFASIREALDCDQKRLVVPAGSVVTPSVRDELLRRKVTLVYDRDVPEPSAAVLLGALVAACVCRGDRSRCSGQR